MIATLNIFKKQMTVEYEYDEDGAIDLIDISCDIDEDLSFEQLHLIKDDIERMNYCEL